MGLCPAGAVSEELWNAGKLSQSVLVPIFLLKNAFRLIRTILAIKQQAENQAPTQDGGPLLRMIQNR